MADFRSTGSTSPFLFFTGTGRSRKSVAVQAAQPTAPYAELNSAKRVPSNTRPALHLPRDCIRDVAHRAPRLLFETPRTGAQVLNRSHYGASSTRTRFRLLSLSQPTSAPAGAISVVPIAIEQPARHSNVRLP